MSNTDSESKDKSDVYYERNILALAFLRALRSAYSMRPEGIEMGWWPDTDDVNEEAWAVVWANLPQGQVGWHVPYQYVPAWLDKRDPEYDGYSTHEKNTRVVRYIENLT